jgi:hypothetical protein
MEEEPGIRWKFDKIMIKKFIQIAEKIRKRYQCLGAHDWIPLDIPPGMGVKGFVDRCAICGSGRYHVPPELDANGFLSPSVMAELRFNVAAMPAAAAPHHPTDTSRTPTVRECEFVEASELVPRHWQEWFWSLVSENAPFSWGDNNRTLVTADSFLEHCESRLADVVDDQITSQEELDLFFRLLEGLGDTYIDLEN